MLLDESDRAILEAKVKELHLSVTAHEDCGAAALAEEIAEDFGGRVKVDGFVAPVVAE